MKSKIHGSKSKIITSVAYGSSHAGKSMPTLVVFCGLALFFCCFTIAASTGGPMGYPTQEDGKEVFVQNCAECHGVRVAEVRPTTKDASKKGPDLTDIGEKYQPGWIKRYVKEEVESGGKNHVKKFKGSDEELQVLVDWLLEQKAEDEDE